MSSLRALVAGATGLVGSALVDQLLDDSSYAEIRLLLRRPSGRSDERLVDVLVDFDDLAAADQHFAGVDHVFCCLGTTLKNAGSRAAFRRVDFDYVASLAQLAAAAGVKKFMLVSSLGADPQAGNFYLRTKGEAETALASQPFTAVHIARPSLLTGARREFRLAERLAAPALRLLSPLLRGGLRRYRPNSADAVAAMLCAAVKGAATGVNIHHLD